MKADAIIREASKHSSINDWASAHQIYAEAIASPSERSPRDSSRLQNEAGSMARNLAVDAFNLGDTVEY